MGFLRAAVLKDLRRYRRDPWALLSWLGIPLFIGLLFSLAFGGEDGPRPRVVVLVADLDGSFLSGLLAGALESDRLELIEAVRVDEAEGRNEIRSGDASALLVIPDGFGDAVLRERPTSLELVTNPSQRILPGIVEELLSTMADAVFYVHRLLGDEIRTLADGPPAGRDGFSDARISEIGVRINGVVDRLVRHLTPLAIRVEALAADDEPEAQGANPDMGRLFLPGILFMALLFMSQGLAGDMWREREQRTLRRVLTTSRTVPSLLLAKLLSAGTMISIVCLIALLVGALTHDVPFAAVPIAIVWASLAGVMLLGLQLVIHVHAQSARAANLISMAIIFPLMMLGGSFFPFQVMPEWMAEIGRLTPNGWALWRLEEIAWGTPDPGSVALGAAVLVAVTAFFFAIAARRVRTMAGAS